MDTSMPFNPYKIYAEMDQILNEEYRKEPYEERFIGPLDLLLKISEDLKIGMGSELVSIDNSGQTTTLNIFELIADIDYPGLKTTVDLIYFNVRNIAIAVLPELFYDFINEIKERLGNMDPYQFSFGIGIKRHFVDIISEVPYSYMEKGRLVQDIKEISKTLRDFFHVNKTMLNLYAKEMSGGI